MNESLLEKQPDDIINYLCTFLSFKDSMNLYQTSKRFHKVQTYSKSHLRLHLRHRLQKLEIDPDEFCNLVQKHKSIVAGSFTLQIVTGREWTSDIDIFTHSPGLIIDLVEQCGYIVDRNITIDRRASQFQLYGDNNNIIKNIYNCVKEDATENHKMIQIIVLSKEKLPNISDYINKVFDLDCCKIMFDGGKFIMSETKNLLRGVTRCNVVTKSTKSTKSTKDTFTSVIQTKTIERISKYYNRGFVVENLDEILDMAYDHHISNDDYGDLFEDSEEEEDGTKRYNFNITKKYPLMMKEPCTKDCRNRRHNHTGSRKKEWDDDQWSFVGDDERHTKVLELSPDKKIIALYNRGHYDVNKIPRISFYVFPRDIPNIKYEDVKVRLLKMLE